VVIYAKIKEIPRKTKWYYVACKKCNRKVSPDEIYSFEDEDNKVVYECKTSTCKGDVIKVFCRCVYYMSVNTLWFLIPYYPTSLGFINLKCLFCRYKVHLDVQDATGTLSLTLWDSLAKKIFKKTAGEMRNDVIRVRV
jgi:hypothetical protein